MQFLLETITFRFTPTIDMPHQQNLCIEDEIENKFVHVLDFNKTLLDTINISSACASTTVQ